MNYFGKNARRLKPSKLVLYVLGTLIGIFTVLAYVNYPGQGYVYLVFTAISTAFLYYGFRKQAIFFDTFIGVFLWLGFWLKLTVKVAFSDGNFHQAVGAFNGSAESFDRALLVATTGLLGFLTASIIRERLIFRYPEKLNENHLSGLFVFYSRNRAIVLWGFVILVVAVTTTNVYLGIYQRGTIPATVLPYGLNGVYKWLLLFGLSVCSSLIIHYELLIRKKATILVPGLGLLETFFSSISLLSRGMILNAGALLFGIYRSLKIREIRASYRSVIVVLLVFCVLFVVAVLLVNRMRADIFYDDASRQAQAAGNVVRSSVSLFIDRWVGMEGVMAVSSSPDLGWKLWVSAWEETFAYGALSFYDKNLIDSPYQDDDFTRHHFVSLPGIVGFFFYTGSFSVLFFGVLMVGIVAAVMEKFAFILGGRNIILCALLAQVIAYRFAHFGYVPRQSYLLFGSIILNLLLIYLFNHLLIRWYRRRGVAGLTEG